jgi:ribonucleoside-diphosphate reductase alpha chain
MAGASGKKLDETYKLAWLRGLKTTYYLRTMGATHAEKSTLNTGQLNAVPASGGMTSAAATRAVSDRAAEPIVASPVTAAGTDMKFCSIDNPECEACQ